MPKARQSRENKEVRDFILRAIPNHPGAIGALAAEKFGLSRTSANRYLKRLEDQGLVHAVGKTSGRRYELRPISERTEIISITPNLAESDVWRQFIEPQLKNVPENIERICDYGFTEIFNNAIDHSGSADALVHYAQNCLSITMTIEDHGIGIFQKILNDFRLADPRSALLELSKGKLTSDKSRHSGEGIFFTSRMFERFTIQSGYLCYSRQRTDDWGWLIESEDMKQFTKGTTVSMTIGTAAPWTIKEIFEKYQNEDMSFSKTHVPVVLGRYGREQLISRSQAKRILARFDRFEEVLLDFQGVGVIGQAFADEIFRVFALAHPKVTITALNVSEDVSKMIAHAKAANPSSPEILP